MVGMRLCPHSIGDVIQRSDGVNPNSLWPQTTWTAITDTFLLGSGSTYTLGATGGESTHTLTKDEMPRHLHNAYYHFTGDSSIGGSWKINMQNSSYGAIGDWPSTKNGTGTTSDDSPGLTGGSQPHNNMPPYVVVDIWQRIA